MQCKIIKGAFQTVKMCYRWHLAYSIMCIKRPKDASKTANLHLLK
nr:MAG TPA: hypothetical protein [Caudoviricetes sp.]